LLHFFSTTVHRGHLVISGECYCQWKGDGIWSGPEAGHRGCWCSSVELIVHVCCCCDVGCYTGETRANTELSLAQYSGMANLPSVGAVP